MSLWLCRYRWYRVFLAWYARRALVRVNRKLKVYQETTIGELPEMRAKRQLRVDALYELKERIDYTLRYCERGY